MAERPVPEARESSRGHATWDVGWLDAHFEACRPEYEAMLRSVGIQPGWRVLDAGCGGGSYLPLMAELVGATGSVVALDLEAENVTAVAERVAAWDFPCPVETHIGGVLALPFPDDSLDAVWCSNTLEYLRDDDLPIALAEFSRVVRAGGVIAVKDSAFAHFLFAPADPARWWRLSTAYGQQSDAGHGLLRSPQTRRWLEAAGLIGVWQQTVLSERWAPLRPAERQFIGDFLVTCAKFAPAGDLPEEDRAFWEEQRDPSSPAHLINHPDFYRCEGHVLAVGRVAA